MKLYMCIMQGALREVKHTTLSLQMHCKLYYYCEMLLHIKQ